MQVVIDIPDETYNQIIEESKLSPRNLDYFERRIANGTPLPKGHGRLIDADYVTKDLNTLQDSFVINIPYAKSCAISIACCAPTILEADAKAESED